nr:putative inorganic phosphate cotransporter isoform X1 [Leptinotarsa decemlineata]
MAPKVNGIIKVYEPLPLSDINADRQRNQYTSELLQSASQKLDSDATGPRFGKRHVQMIVYFLLMFTSFCVRVNMSVAIVAMTDPNASINKDIPTYNWTDKNVIQSSFFWGYIFPQVSAGWLASRFGPKWFLIGTMGVTSVAGLLLPTLAATFDSKGVMFCRALQGFCQGFVFPSVHGLLAKWVPSPERSRLGTFVYIASPVGTVVCMLLTGYISAGWYGWPMALYLFNGLGLVWCLMFAYIGCNSPAVHPTISREERFYIENSLGQQDSTKKIPTPWIKMMLSGPFWTLIITQCGFVWGYWTLQTQMPLYMSGVMHFDIKSNSLLSSLPYFVQLATGPLFSCLSDAMINKGICSIATTRKIMNFFGLFVPGIALAIVANIRIDQPEMAVVLLVSAVAFNSACMSGFIVNHMDLSPNHAGILMGISNAISHCCAIMALLFAQYVVTDEGNIAQWKIMFYSAAGIYMAVTILFFIFGSGTTQPWNDEEEKPKSGA